MLSLRDNTAYGPDAVMREMFDCNKSHGLTWLAFDDDGCAIAISSAELRTISGPGETADDAQTFAYWENLFVHPEKRDGLAYVVLHGRMKRDLRELGARAIYCAVRRPDVIDLHKKVRFKEVGKAAVDVRVANPISIASDYVHPPRASVKASETTRNGNSLHEHAVPFSETNLSNFVGTANAQPLSTSDCQLHHVWNERALTRRLTPRAAWGSSHLLTVQNAQQTYRVIVKLDNLMNRIRAGYILKITPTAPNDDTLRSLLDQTVTYLRKRGAGVVVAAATDNKPSLLTKRISYSLLIMNLAGKETLPFPRFDLLEHDAF